MHDVAYVPSAKALPLGAKNCDCKLAYCSFDSLSKVAKIDMLRLRCLDGCRVVGGNFPATGGSPQSLFAKPPHPLPYLASLSSLVTGDLDLTGDLAAVARPDLASLEADLASLAESHGPYSLGAGFSPIHTSKAGISGTCAAVVAAFAAAI